MKFTPLKKLSALTLLASSVAIGHSAMFTDYFVFDDSNEGEPTAMAKALARGDTQASRATVCSGGSAGGYPCEKVDFQSFLPKASMGGGSADLNDIWGWTDPLTGQEIAIVGRINGTSFVDVTNASSPVFLGFLPTNNARLGRNDWRDMKTFDDHVFIVADGLGNSEHGLQVYDLNNLRDITDPGGTLSATATLGGFGNAHNIAINEDSGFAYIVGANQCSGGLYMVDISSPSQPSFAGCFSADGYTHDAQCVIYNGPDTSYRGREICVAYNEDTMTIVDVSNKSNPVQISRRGYSGSRYTHQGWFLNGSHEFLILNDELDEQRNSINTTSYIWNMSDLDQPREIGRYVGPTQAIDHNLYTRDGYVFEANYRAGLRILSSDRISNGELEEVAFFDTIPGSNSAQFSGVWSSYVEFESRNIILSDIGNGLFVVKPDWDAITGGSMPTPMPTVLPPTPLPSPSIDCIYIQNFEDNNDGWTNSGSTCSTGTFERGTPTQTTANGITIQAEGGSQSANAWFTAVNTRLGTDDVDGGTCQTTSPVVNASNLTKVSVSLSYFAGQRDTGDDANDGITVEVLNNGVVVETLVDIGDETNEAQWRQVSANVPNPGNIQVRMRATDAAGPTDIVEAGLDNVQVCSTGGTGPTPLPSPSPAPRCSVEEGFENGAGGWRNSSASNCSTGAFVTGSPTEIISRGVTTQVDGANSGNNAYFTAANSAAGINDVDGGNCIASSPSYSVESNSTLSVSYFHGQRDAGDDPSGDFFKLEVSTDGGNTFSSVASAGDVTSNASWTRANAPIRSGSNVVLRVQCSDGAATNAGDLVECGLDDVSICPNY